MKISQIYHLNKSQAEIDFVDIDPEQDLRLFLDPFFLSKRPDNWSSEATLTLRSFFSVLIDYIRRGRENEAKMLFRHLHEPNSTCLGMSTGNPKGRGVGSDDTDKIYESLLNSKAIQTGLIRDIEDNILFVENFGSDKLSDMTTNIIAGHLIEYTQNQCVLHNIALTSQIPSGYYWNRNVNEWENNYTDMLVIENKKILLVPKGIVSFSKSYTPEKYYNGFVLEFLQNEHLGIQSALTQERKNGTKYVTKKSLKEIHPSSKEFLRNFTQKHPEVLEQFKSETDLDPLLDLEYSDINIAGVIKKLVSNLQSLKSGNDFAHDFHNLMIGILEMIFYPHLINPVKEAEIHQGRKRIDICFDNASRNGIFHRLLENFGIPCHYIFVECKNYSRDIANPELDQMGGRFSRRKGQVGFVVCRQIDNMGLFLERCKDNYSDDRGLIIPLVDNDIINMLENYEGWNSEYVEKFLSDRIRMITLN